MAESSPSPLPLRERSPLLRWLRGASRPASSAARRADRLSWREAILVSELPPPVRLLVERVVRRIRCTNGERRDTAHELLAHFDDALRSGRTVEQSIADFGDERRAARLLRRAIRRKRGRAWKAWWWSSRTAGVAVAALSIAYGALAARFWLTRPTIGVNYEVRLNSLIAERATGATAWGEYRAALMHLNPTERELARTVAREPGDWRPAEPTPINDDRPGTAAWEAAERALVAMAPHLDRLREGARRPSLGVRVGEFAAEDLELYPQSVASRSASGDSDRGGLFSTVLPYLAEVRRAAQWLACDARHRAARGDLDGAIGDLESILGVARQLDRPLMVDQLVGMALVAMAAELSNTLIVRWPDGWTMERLDRLAGLIDSVRGKDLRIHFDGERLCFSDVLQRCYSDDGAGDGRLLASSLRVTGVATDDRRASLTSSLALPAKALVQPSRREAQALRDAAVERAEAVQSLPPPQWTAALLPDPPKKDGDSLRGIAGADWLDEWIRGESLVRAATTSAKLRTRLDVSRVAIALHRHRATTGRWPETLAAMVPSCLAAVPEDPFTGAPLRYAVRNETPFVWSAGPDLRDDGLAHAWPGQCLYDMIGRPAERGAAYPPPAADIQLWPPLMDAVSP